MNSSSASTSNDQSLFLPSLAVVLLISYTIIQNFDCSELKAMGTIELSHAVKLLNQLAKGFVESSGFLMVASSLICNYSA